MRLFEIAGANPRAKIAGSQLQMVLYHGSDQEIHKFRKGPQGVFFSPYESWAANYGDVITSAYVWAPKVYIVGDNEGDDDILDALFDRDYDTLAMYIQKLQTAGYYALQTRTDSEMVCTFPNAKIYSANTGQEM